MHAAAARGELSPEVVKKYDKATQRKPGGFESLPGRVREKRKDLKMTVVLKAAGEARRKVKKPNAEQKALAYARLKTRAQIPYTAAAARSGALGSLVGTLLTNRPRAGTAVGGALGVSSGIRSVQKAKEHLALEKVMKRHNRKTAHQLPTQTPLLVTKEAAAHPRFLRDATFAAAVAELALEKLAEPGAIDFRDAFYPHDSEGLRARANPENTDDLPELTSASRALAHGTVLGNLPRLFNGYGKAAKQTRATVARLFDRGPTARSRSVFLQGR